MARPNPTILAEHTRGYYQEQVLKANSITVLTYNNQPVSYRVINQLTGQKQYPKTASVNPAFIQKLADDLNTLYKTTAFRAVTWKGNDESNTSTSNTTTTNKGRSI